MADTSVHVGNVGSNKKLSQSTHPPDPCPLRLRTSPSLTPTHAHTLSKEALPFGRTMRQSYTQRVTERRLMYLLAAITAMLFAVKNYQETHTAAFDRTSLVPGSQAGAGSDIEDAAKEVKRALEGKARKEEEARKQVQSKKKKVALAVFVHEVMSSVNQFLFFPHTPTLQAGPLRP